jgi:hypothetical protein
MPRGQPRWYLTEQATPLVFAGFAPDQRAAAAALPCPMPIVQPPNAPVVAAATAVAISIAAAPPRPAAASALAAMRDVEQSAPKRHRQALTEDAATDREKVLELQRQLAVLQQAMYQRVPAGEPTGSGGRREQQQALRRAAPQPAGRAGSGRAKGGRDYDEDVEDCNEDEEEGEAGEEESGDDF